MNDTIKRLIGNFLYIIFIMYFLVKGMEWERDLKLLAGTTYNPYPHLVFLSIFPIIIGTFLAIPDFINKTKNQGNWYFDWVKLIAIGIPTLYVAISPALYFSPIGKYLPKIGSVMLFYSSTPLIVCGIIFGYILLSSFNKQNRNDML